MLFCVLYDHFVHLSISIRNFTRRINLSEYYFGFFGFYEKWKFLKRKKKTSRDDNDYEIDCIVHGVWIGDKIMAAHES